MQFQSISRVFQIVLLAAALAACGGRDEIKKGTSDIAASNAPTSFDLTVVADRTASSTWMARR